MIIFFTTLLVSELFKFETSYYPNQCPSKTKGSKFEVTFMKFWKLRVVSRKFTCPYFLLINLFFFKFCSSFFLRNGDIGTWSAERFLKSVVSTRNTSHIRYVPSTVGVVDTGFSDTGVFSFGPTYVWVVPFLPRSTWGSTDTGL